MYVGILWGIKLILDFFWNYTWQDYAVFCIAILFIASAFLNVIKEKSLITKQKLFAFCPIALLSIIVAISFLKNINAESFKALAAWGSNAMIYLSLLFLLANKEDKKVALDIMWKFYHLLYWVLIGSCLIGKGVIIWQGQVTLRGLYYYKTDYALFIIQFTIFLVYRFVTEWKNTNVKNKVKKVYFYGLLCLNLLLLLAINTRMIVLIYFVMLVPGWFWTTNKKTQDMLKWYVPVLLVISLIIGMFVIKGYALASSQILKNINIDFTAIQSNKDIDKDKLKYNVLTYYIDESVLSDRNTNGRVTAWKMCMKYYSEKLSLSQKIVGIDLVTVNETQDYIDHGPHNSYIWLLFAAGIIGVILLLVWGGYLVFQLFIQESSDLSYLTLLVTICMVSLAVTQVIIIESQHTWLFFMCVAMFQTNIFEVNREKKVEVIE